MYVIKKSEIFLHLFLYNFSLYAHIFQFLTHLKKSFLQYNFDSLLKHFSVNGWRHSQQRTQDACHPRSRTFNKNLSNIGLLQPAHGSPTPTGGSLRPAKTDKNCGNVR